MLAFLFLFPSKIDLDDPLIILHLIHRAFAQHGALVQDGDFASDLADEGVDLAWFTTREREYDEILPWDHLDAGLERDWLWQDWLAAIDPSGADEVEDCRWTPCFECGVCPAMGTEIQAGPTGAKLLPLAVAAGRAPARPSDTPVAQQAAAPAGASPGHVSLPGGPVRHAGTGGGA